MSKQETAAQLRKVANFMKGLIQAADDIEAIGSMEGATKEAAQARDLAVNERDQALAEAADAKAKGKAEADKAKKKAEDVAAAVMAKAQADSVEMLRKADAAAKQTTDHASAQAKSILSGAEGKAWKAAGEVEALQAQATALEQQNADAQVALNAARAEHEKLTKALNALKAKFKIAD
jgi:hypothetical protein